MRHSGQFSFGIIAAIYCKVLVQDFFEIHKSLSLPDFPPGPIAVLAFLGSSIEIYSRISNYRASWGRLNYMVNRIIIYID